jgi:uncharacterized protein with ATP-grasp and redox domains
MDERCINCFSDGYSRLLKKFPITPTQEALFGEFFSKQIAECNNLSNPELQQILYRRLSEINGFHDPFAAEKRHSNQIALGLYDHWLLKVDSSDNGFDTALRLSIAGNIMDYGALSSFNLNGTIEMVMKSHFAIDQSHALQKKIEEAQSILYLGDNAGEIVFDKLFIKTMNRAGITYAVKGGPAINDATIEDAIAVDIQSVANVITNGDSAPSTILQHCSNEFQEAFKNADVIIAKGQGNLEGLLNIADNRIFFLLMVKCDVIAEILHVKKGSFVVYQAQTNITNQSIQP